MVRRVNVWILATVLLRIGAHGFTLSDLYSSNELDDFDSDVDSSIEETDYWNLLSELSGSVCGSNVHANTSDDEKWNEIDNLDLNDDAEAEIGEIIQLNRFSELQQTTIKYQLGRRVRGDNVVAFSAKNQTWPQVQNVRTNLTYPAAGVVGRKLTYIEIQVNQTSNLGRAYVARGGVGQRFITVIVEATNTFYFNFKSTFYGL